MAQSSPLYHISTCDGLSLSLVNHSVNRGYPHGHLCKVGVVGTDINVMSGNMQANSCFILIGAHVVYGWLILDNWLLLISSQVEYLWFQQKQVEALGTDILVYAALFLQQLIITEVTAA